MLTIFKPSVGPGGGGVTKADYRWIRLISALQTLHFRDKHAVGELAYVASVSVRFESRERGTRVKMAQAKE